MSDQDLIGLCLLISALAAAFFARAWSNLWIQKKYAEADAKKAAEKLRNRKDFERADYYALPKD